VGLTVVLGAGAFRPRPAVDADQRELDEPPTVRFQADPR
jgi:hypothetical protein